MPGPAWPQKTHELRTRFFDSTVWNDFEFRDDDIVIVTYAKSGTTWMQQIVAQLIFDGACAAPLHQISPWLDMRLEDKDATLSGLAAQQHRRFIKTHLPIDALVYAPQAKYIYVARDGRDTAWSLYNHHFNMTPEAYDQLNSGPDALGAPFPRLASSVRDYFLQWLERDGYPMWPFWSHVNGWCEAVALPNLLIVHYADLQADLPGQIRRIAGFLGIALDPARLAVITAHCRFDYMKANAESVVPSGGRPWHGGATTFMHRGTNGRWRETLTQADVARYENEAYNRLGVPRAVWLAEGSMLSRVAS